MIRNIQKTKQNSLTPQGSSNCPLTEEATATCCSKGRAFQNREMRMENEISNIMPYECRSTKSPMQSGNPVSWLSSSMSLRKRVMRVELRRQSECLTPSNWSVTQSSPAEKSAGFHGLQA